MARNLNPNSPLARQKRKAEIDIIETALRATGDLHIAASALGVTPTYLHSRIRILQMSPIEGVRMWRRRINNGSEEQNGIDEDTTLKENEDEELELLADDEDD